MIIVKNKRVVSRVSPKAVDIDYFVPKSNGFSNKASYRYLENVCTADTLVIRMYYLTDKRPSNDSTEEATTFTVKDIPIARVSKSDDDIILDHIVSTVIINSLYSNVIYMIDSKLARNIDIGGIIDLHEYLNRVINTGVFSAYNMYYGNHTTRHKAMKKNKYLDYYFKHYSKEFEAVVTKFHFYRNLGSFIEEGTPTVWAKLEHRDKYTSYSPYVLQIPNDSGVSPLYELTLKADDKLYLNSYINLAIGAVKDVTGFDKYVLTRTLDKIDITAPLMSLASNLCRSCDIDMPIDIIYAPALYYYGNAEYYPLFDN